MESQLKKIFACLTGSIAEFFEDSEPLQGLGSKEPVRVALLAILLILYFRILDKKDLIDLGNLSGNLRFQQGGLLFMTGGPI